MSEELSKKCDMHSDRFECPDALIAYAPRSKTYGIIVHDGGSSTIGIDFCPWCGAKLEKKRAEPAATAQRPCFHLNRR
jgi:hypothetical protein